MREKLCRHENFRQGRRYGEDRYNSRLNAIVCGDMGHTVNLYVVLCRRGCGKRAALEMTGYLWRCVLAQIVRIMLVLYNFPHLSLSQKERVLETISFR